MQHTQSRIYELENKGYGYRNNGKYSVGGSYWFGNLGRKFAELAGDISFLEKVIKYGSPLLLIQVLSFFAIGCIMSYQQQEINLLQADMIRFEALLTLPLSEIGNLKPSSN